MVRMSHTLEVLGGGGCMESYAQQPDNVRLVAGVELAESAMRIAVTLTADPHGRRWQQRLPTPPTPDETVEVIAGLIERAWADAVGAPAASVVSANSQGAVGV